MIPHRLFGVLLCFVLLAGTAHAQQAGDTGVVMGYPASVGFIWHVTDGIAIRPAIAFTHASTEVEDGDGVLDIESSAWSLGLNVAALIYVQNDDRLKTYFAPAFSYSRVDSEQETNLPIPAGPVRVNVDEQLDAWGFSGSFGGQYSLSDRFGLFGEVGIDFNWGSTSGDDDDFVSTETKITRWGTRGAVGVILYF